MARTYTAAHTVDQLGGRYADETIDYTGPDLAAAQAIAEEFTAAGQCGCVRRDDGAVLAPDGEWLQ